MHEPSRSTHKPPLLAPRQPREARAGGIAPSLQGPMDKGNLLEDILLSQAAASGDGSVPAIYIGDSVGDLAALLAASYPIVLGNNTKLRLALHHFGCTLHPLAEALPLDHDHPPGTPLVTAGCSCA